MPTFEGLLVCCFVVVVLFLGGFWGGLGGRGGLGWGFVGAGGQSQ